MNTLFQNLSVPICLFVINLTIINIRAYTVAKHRKLVLLTATIPPPPTKHICPKSKLFFMGFCVKYFIASSRQNQNYLLIFLLSNYLWRLFVFDNL